MQTENRLLDDLAKMAAGAVGGLSGMKHEIETRLREQVERVLNRMNLVSREEFDVVRAMVAESRNAQEELQARVAALEAKLAGQVGDQPC